MQHNSTYPIANQNTSNPGLLRMIPAHYSSNPFQITECLAKSLVIIWRVAAIQKTNIWWPAFLTQTEASIKQIKIHALQWKPHKYI